jgi:ATP-dependent Lon protease
MKIIKSINKDFNKKENEYPLIPLREIIIFPGAEASFYVGRRESIEAVNLAKSLYDNYLFLSCQKNADVENPQMQDIYTTGIIALIKDVSLGPDKNILKLTISAIERARIVSFFEENNVKKVIVERIKLQKLDDSKKSEALLNIILKEFKKFINLTKMPREVVVNITGVLDEDMLINAILPHLKATLDKKMEILEEEDILKRLTLLAELISSNIEIIQLEKKINFEVRKKLDKNQKEYFLNEQIKEIQKELGNNNHSDEYSSIEDFEKKLVTLGMPEAVKDKALKEFKKLIKIPSFTPEAGVIRNYIDCLIELPWSKKSEDSKDIALAKKILDEDHYSLKKVKNRILEFISVRQLNPSTKGPILCFVGPPGTGKTSLGKSVARALGREFIRISLGGVRDEAEIRGHRRTYLGALPGKIIQSMKKAKTVNPIFLLDEIDKMSSDFRGDPASALLEVLDPEQNNQFVDHYLDIPYDLKEVMFITTANSKQGIPYALLDRMELIYISGYTENEKLKIAQRFLMPREQKENGIENINISMSSDVIIYIIRHYTMEAGVRSLQRQIASICRRIARYIVATKKDIKEIKITKKKLVKFLGKPKYLQSAIDENLDIGVSHGLAWSEFGGSVLPIEVVLYPGSGKIILTGKLGDVMKESAQTAFSYIRANAHLFDIKIKNFYKNYDVHIHFPEGAIPKDGPSAGIAITCGILSALTKKPMKSKYAMTGEITLTGKVLPIGGLKEKSLAALRHKKEKILIPFENEKDLDDLPKVVKNKIEFITVKNAMDVFKIVFDDDIFIKEKNEKTKKDSPRIIIDNKAINNQDYDILTQ